MTTQINSELKYQVKYFRDAGLEVQWTKGVGGQPFIIGKNPNGQHEWQRNKWWMIDDAMFKLMKEYGIVEGFNMSTILGDIFFI